MSISSSPASPPPPESSRHGRAAFVFIFLTVCLDMLALGIIVPVLPKLVVEFEGGDIAKAALFTQVFHAALVANESVRLPGAPYLLAALLVAASLITAALVSRGIAPTPRRSSTHPSG